MKTHLIEKKSFFWALEAVCNLHRKPYSARLASQQITPPFYDTGFVAAAKVLGFSAEQHTLQLEELHQHTSFPLVILSTNNADSSTTEDETEVVLKVILHADKSGLLIAEHDRNSPSNMPLEKLSKSYLGYAITLMPESLNLPNSDTEEVMREERRFGFSWFIPELRRHKRIWQEILLASLVIQLIAMATPLFTQTIIDKVVVHRTESTLIVVIIGMAILMLFTSILTWVRQYLVLHTGNRIDAMLGSAVFERLFKLPPLYFQSRPTGVIAARLQGVETVREFISSAAVTLILDLPFLALFTTIMFYYNIVLTLIVVAILIFIVLISLTVAPIFQNRLREQFQLGARNQAFITEYIVGLETVKSLQLEPQLTSKYRGFLSSYLVAGFATKQLANSYNTFANSLEQLMTLLVLAIGAYTVMHSTDFTIGMLVAFQMYSGRLSQPMLRLVGLWQQFQQASLSINRLGDLMNAPVEPYSLIPSRALQRRGEIRIEEVAFRYSDEAPMIYERLSFKVEAGQAIAIMGPSGCGKSTLAKMLQGFYQPSAGRILIDEVDIRHLSANELRGYFGVVPQETVLFSGTIYDNLQMASPDATFDQIVAACRMAEIHSVIETLPNGYQTEIGERGAGLSGGQKQRIAIARALLKRPSILIFDEATSALDGKTAEQFARTINSLKGKVSMLFITHALPRGLIVDKIFGLGPQGVQLLSNTYSEKSKAETQVV